MNCDNCKYKEGDGCSYCKKSNPGMIGWNVCDRMPMGISALFELQGRLQWASMMGVGDRRKKANQKKTKMLRDVEYNVSQWMENDGWGKTSEFYKRYYCR